MTRLVDLDFIELSIDTRVRYLDGRAGSQTWSVRVTAQDHEDKPPTPVFWMDGWSFRLGAGSDLAGELDALSADAAVFIPLVDGDGLAERIVEDLDLVPLGDRLLLINHVTLDPVLRHRGGIGRYLTGLVVRELYGSAALVALHASPFELRQDFDDGDVPDEVWEAGARALAPVWESLGFQRFDGHLYVLDPTRTALDDALTSLLSRSS